MSAPHDLRYGKDLIGRRMVNHHGCIKQLDWAAFKSCCVLVIKRSTQLLLIVWLIVWLIGSAKAMAQSNDDSAYILVQDARLRNGLSGLELNADADIQLSPEIRRGLDSGVPLQFIVDFKIKQPRQLWPDKTLFAQQHRFSLIYYELTRHYRLRSLKTNESRNFRSLLAALEELGQLQGLHVSPVFALDEYSGLFGVLSMRLDSKALPLPLQPLLSSAWRLSSEDFAWSLN